MELLHIFIVTVMDAWKSFALAPLEKAPMRPSIDAGGLATILIGELNARVHAQDLASVPGFGGAVVLCAVGPFVKRIVYARWFDRAAAAAQRDGPPLEAIDVRLRATPQKRDSSISLDWDRHVVLVTRWIVEPEQSDALLAELQRFTDYFLPKARGVISTAFLVSADRRVVVEYLQAKSVWTMLRIQFSLRLRRHVSQVARVAAASDLGLYRVEHTILAQ